MARVLYLSQWFPPENGAVGLQVAKALQERGHVVEVLTGFPNYPSGRLAPGYRLAAHRREIVQGVTVHRVWLYPSHDRSSVGRTANYLSFFASSLAFLLAKGRSYDVVYVYHPPVTPALAAALSGFLTRRPFVMEIQDLWPDSVAVAGMPGSAKIARLLSPICAFVYRRSAVVLGQSEGMTRRLLERGVSPSKAGTVFNWADEAAVRVRSPLTGKCPDSRPTFDFVYAGNFGTVQALEVLVEAALRAAREEPKVRLKLIGDGTERASLRALANRSGGIVEVRDAVPITHIGDILAQADVLVAHLKDDPLFEITIPSKLQFYLAMGQPVLAAIKGEAARIVEHAGAGLAVQPGDASAIAEAMVTMARTSEAELAAMGGAARSAYEAHFSFAVSLDARARAVDRALASVGRTNV